MVGLWEFKRGGGAKWMQAEELEGRRRTQRASRGSRIPEQGYVDMWIWICGYVDMWVCGYVGVWICGCVDMDMWIYGSRLKSSRAGDRNSESFPRVTHSRVRICGYGYLDMRICGYVDMWIQAEELEGKRRTQKSFPRVTHSRARICFKYGCRQLVSLCFFKYCSRENYDIIWEFFL